MKTRKVGLDLSHREFLVDAEGDTEEIEIINRRVTGALSEFFDVVKITATRLPTAKFPLVEPMAKLALIWYTEALEILSKDFKTRVGAFGLVNVDLIKETETKSQMFGQYGVHLTPEAGKSFNEAIMYYADKLFNIQETVDLEMEEEPVLPTMTTGLRDESGPIATPIAAKPAAERSILEQLEDIRIEMRRKQYNVSMVLARVRERLDFILNTKKKDRLCYGLDKCS